MWCCWESFRNRCRSALNTGTDVCGLAASSDDQQRTTVHWRTRGTKNPRLTGQKCHRTRFYALIVRSNMHLGAARNPTGWVCSVHQSPDPLTGGRGPRISALPASTVLPPRQIPGYAYVTTAGSYSASSIQPSLSSSELLIRTGCTPVSPIIHDRRLRQFGHNTQNISAQGWIIDKPSELQSKVHQLAGEDPEEDHDRHGHSEPLKLRAEDHTDWNELMETAACTLHPGAWLIMY